ncbi:MAG: hypothetical protein IT356_04530 [Gemmatimonadaceae bacterium]|nr:hypothetical protein [Gemmatimonadaceae bacterium]
MRAREALARLRAGNERFRAHLAGQRGALAATVHTRLTVEHKPFAILLGCSDARVPAEIIFDEWVGDLFVIRVAGNVVAPSVIASVEFSAEAFGTRLVVVMGHTQCGAVGATIDAVLHPATGQPRGVTDIVDRIRPVVEPLVRTNLAGDRDALSLRAVRANVRASANQLRHGSRILEQLAASDGLVVVGAEYAIETGMVEFFDGVPQD